MGAESAQGHSPGTARRTKPGFQNKPRLRLTGTSSVDSWLLATRCSGLEGHGLRIHREKSVRSAFPGQRWILPASACWHMSSQFLFRRRCTMCDSGPEPHPCHTVNANPPHPAPTQNENNNHADHDHVPATVLPRTLPHGSQTPESHENRDTRIQQGDFR